MVGDCIYNDEEDIAYKWRLTSSAESWKDGERLPLFLSKHHEEAKPAIAVLLVKNEMILDREQDRAKLASGSILTRKQKHNLLAYHCYLGKFHSIGPFSHDFLYI
jgi:hypothetical protein